jgi:hypothetical protein
MAPPKMPWFRFYVEAAGDRKLRRLTPGERWLWVMVLAAARHSPVPGVLLVTDDEPMTMAELADFAGMKEREVRAGVEKMDGLGLLYERGDGALVVPKWDARQPVSDDVTARTRKHRTRAKATPPDDKPPPMERSIPVPSNGSSTFPGTGSERVGNVDGTDQSKKQIQRQIPSQSAVTAAGPAPEPVDDDDRDPSLRLLTATAAVLGTRDHERRLAAQRPGLEPISPAGADAHRQRCIERRCGDERLAELVLANPKLEPEQLADLAEPPARPVLSVVPEGPPTPPEYEPEPACEVASPDVVRAALAAARAPRSAG